MSGLIELSVMKVHTDKAINSTGRTANPEKGTGDTGYLSTEE